jgi:hypothetical protein
LRRAAKGGDGEIRSEGRRDHKGVWMRRTLLAALGAAAASFALLIMSGAASGHPGQHGPNEGHLVGTGAWGKIALVGSVRVHDATEPELIADVAVDPDLDYAYLARSGGEACAGPEGARGGRVVDGGVYVIDIRDDAGNLLPQPVEVGFIPTHQDTLVGEGMQVVHLETTEFTGDVLLMNHEQCGKNYKGGISLWDVTDPLKPKKLSEHFGDFAEGPTDGGILNRPHDANQTHSAFIWQDDGRAYLVATDDEDPFDVDIFDITDPKHPKLINELNLNTFVPGGVDQPELFLTDSFLHDMVVKEINGRQIMLLSYWDGGWVLLDVTDPTNPTYIGDTDYAAVNQLIGNGMLPEGNAHQAEFTIDNRFFIGTDEDFDPYRLFATIDGNRRPLSFGQGVDATGQTETVPILTPGQTLTGPAVFVGRACTAASIPSAPTTGDAIAVIERGDCDFQVKLVNVQAAGYDAAVIFNNTTGSPPCEGLLNMIVAPNTVTIPSFFVARSAGYALLGISGYNPDNCPNGTNPALPRIGTANETITLSMLFDGWGYVRLFDAQTLQELDQFAIPEALDPAFAFGFGDLSVHEVAVDPQDASLAYLSYYAGGLRAIQIQCSNPADTSTCELVEVGGYLDPHGNNFWGVETFIDPKTGDTIILASDMDSGLWIFRDP